MKGSSDKIFMGASTKQGYDIAIKSREIIRNLIHDDIKDLNSAERDIVERIVHSTADPEYGKLVSISSDFVEASLKSLKNNETILTDINMVKAGITQYSGLVECFIKNEDVKKIAKEYKITRAAAAIRFAALNNFEGIIAIGNAPTALYEAINLFEKNELNVKSIIGVPVGFVGAADSKDTLHRTNIPNIIINGPKGGTPIAVACVNSMIQSLNEGV
ncbi:MAG: cobalt-precorrin-8 methylmutase [Methanobrevibacter sp.]|jgi:precorrin-8X/cobalt-precorrin-8 methylmutase|nr:cobalt-precorrin-8 methylmutase [Methanobrevibacter sp.]